MGYKEDLFSYTESGVILEQTAHRTRGCLIVGSVQGQVVWGFE